jgi:hypothetical protein
MAMFFQRLWQWLLFALHKRSGLCSASARHNRTIRTHRSCCCLWPSTFAFAVCVTVLERTTIALRCSRCTTSQCTLWVFVLERIERLWHLCNSLYTLGCSTHLPTLAYFSLFITTINDGNIYIEYHMDFPRNHAHLAGGDTRKAPKNTQFSKSRHTPRGQGSPPRQPLPIHQITAKPLNPF